MSGLESIAGSAVAGSKFLFASCLTRARGGIDL